MAAQRTIDTPDASGKWSDTTNKGNPSPAAGLSGMLHLAVLAAIAVGGSPRLSAEQTEERDHIVAADRLADSLIRKVGAIHHFLSAPRSVCANPTTPGNPHLWSSSFVAQVVGIAPGPISHRDQTHRGIGLVDA